MTKRSTILITASLAVLLTAFFPLSRARADIFEWEYINPSNPSEGKQESTMLAPEGAGANAMPYADLSGRNLTKAYLIGADLTFAFASGANLTNADLSQTNLTGAYFGDDFESSHPSAVLTGANLSQANLRHAYFDFADLTSATLTQANLTNASLIHSWLANANLSQANLTSAMLFAATLTGANLTGADVRGANLGSTGITAAQLSSTASYLSHDFGGISLGGNDLTGVNLAGQNLTNADFYGATLSGANFTGAEVRGANFGLSAITPDQLYSTASYQAHNLTGMKLSGNYTGLNLAGQNLTNGVFRIATLTNANLSYANLTNADFSSFDFASSSVSSDLTGANLSQANLTSANFAGILECIDYQGCHVVPGANLTGANLSGADARGARFIYATLSGANTANLIQSDGHIAGLNLTAGASLLVRDYDGKTTADPTPISPQPIVVDGHLAMDATGTLRLVFDADPWDSTISFAPGIPVTLGGTLDLTFEPGFDVATQIGRTIDLFNWTGVTPTGAFAVSSPYTWNLSKLYTTGEVTLTALAAIPGDFNNNGVVDAADYIVWRKTDGTPTGFNAWRTHFGQPTGSGAALPSAELLSTVPEPAALALLMFAAAGLCLRRGRAG